MKKKLLAVVVAVSIVFCMLPLGMVLSAADVAGVNASAAGACGPVGPDNGPLDTVIWTYVDGKLTVSGTGDMGNFTAETLPWAQYVPEISSIVVSEGVTSIGTGAFRNLPATALSVNLPSTVTAIYDDAFSGDAGLTWGTAHSQEQALRRWPCPTALPSWGRAFSLKMLPFPLLPFLPDFLPSAIICSLTARRLMP